MKIRKKLKKIIIDLTLKTPLVSLLVVTITVLSIYVLVSTNYTNIYIKINGKVFTEKDTILVGINLDKKYYKGITVNSNVLWYVNENSVRYNAKIYEISPPEGDKFDIKIKPEKADYDREAKDLDNLKSKEVNVEVFLKKIKIIDKLFAGKMGGQDEE